MRAVPTTPAGYVQPHNSSRHAKDLEKAVIWPFEMIGALVLWAITLIVGVVAVIVVGIPDLARYLRMKRM